MIVREYKTVKDEDVIKGISQNYIEGVAGLDNALAERIVSRPASGEKQIFNIVWDPLREEIIIEISVTTEE
ncbi:unnamed protein product [marine sediment metagenome]|uniref:Uncharacterized protein n=1 Tax=marine sediment metagenome TaxID=412755 RepID=X1J8S0_9ZZZZ